MRRLLILSIVTAIAVGSYPGLSRSDDEATADATASAKPEEAKTLTIGSEAPALDIEHWLHAEETGAEPVTSFKPGNVYVVEFWATWCPPCRASMPHLKELQEKFADDQVTIISVSDEDVATIEPFLEQEVPGQEAAEEGAGPVTFGEITKAYQLTTDPDKSVHQDYMRAANQNGIPTSFVVGKDGHIEWIGHPMSLDEPLQKIVAGEWDREAFATEFKEQQEFSTMMQSVIQLARAGKMDEALTALDDFAAKTSSDELKERARSLVKPVKATVFQRWVMSDQAKAAGWLKEQTADEDADQELNVEMSSMLVQFGAQGGRELSGDLIDAAIGAVKAAEGDEAIVEALQEIKTKQEEAAAEAAAQEKEEADKAEEAEEAGDE